ncbi:MAG TPA: FAD/NAD(P)-binding protein [Acidimicrobiales bacterium]|jgi:glycine/D-amino acid oxidase-like deaminating enzyme
MEKRSRTVIVGGGASGVLLAAHLRRRQPDARITMVDSSDRPERGRPTGHPTRVICSTWRPMECRPGPTAFIAIHALLVHAANNDVAAIRSLEVPGLTDGQATTLTSIQSGLAALLEEQPRRALDHLLEALPGLPGLGGSRAQQEGVLETALAAMLQLGAPGQAARLLSRHRSAATTPGVRRDAVS